MKFLSFAFSLILHILLIILIYLIIFHINKKPVAKLSPPLYHEQLINQIESKVGNDLQYIRINGSIVGSIIGFVIAIASLIIKKI